MTTRIKAAIVGLFMLAIGFSWAAPSSALAVCTHTGTAGTDYLYGTSAADALCGLAGNDYLYGRLGSDSIVGGAGTDYIYGEAGDDSINSVDGEVDYVYCGPGTDTVNADPQDVLYHCENVAIAHT